MNAPHLHLILNHFPVVGSLFVLALGLFAFRSRNPDLVRAHLWGQVALGFLALAAFFSGTAAEEAVENLPGISKGLLEAHEESAYLALALLVVGAAVALAATWLGRKRGGVPRGALVLALLILAASAGASAWTANRGGRIRHPEIVPTQGPSLSQPAEEGGRRRGRDDG